MQAKLASRLLEGNKETCQLHSSKLIVHNAYVRLVHSATDVCFGEVAELYEATPKKKSKYLTQPGQICVVCFFCFCYSGLLGCF